MGEMLEALIPSNGLKSGIRSDPNKISPVNKIYLTRIRLPLDPKILTPYP